MQHARRHAWTLVLLGTVGCFEVKQPDCAFTCVYGSAETPCPGGYVCREDGYCHREGGAGACGGRPSDAGQPDVPQALDGNEADTVATDAVVADAPGDGPCVASCADVPCGSSNACGTICVMGSGCQCTPGCEGKLCDVDDGCGAICAPGSGCCTPTCAGEPCGASDGCSGLCQAGSGCCNNSCNGVPCGSANACGTTCSAGSGCSASCAGLSATCGPAGTASCCDSNLVPGGTYNRSNNASYPATVSDFKLDVYEVTVGRFRKFVDAGKGTLASPPGDGTGANPNLAGSGWNATAWNGSLVADTTVLKAAVKCSSSYQTWTDSAGGNESRPMNCLTWYEAFAFCIWDGGRLPTEAEWNYAAAGGSEQREYPWSVPPSSMTIDCEHASYYLDSTTQCCGDGVVGCALTDLINVGTKPPGNGRWGQADLGGNVWEWVLDWYANYSSTCNNCATLTPPSYRVIRGGGFDSSASYLLSSGRNHGTPAYRSFYVGARCARTP